MLKSVQLLVKLCIDSWMAVTNTRRRKTSIHVEISSSSVIINILHLTFGHQNWLFVVNKLGFTDAILSFSENLLIGWPCIRLGLMSKWWHLQIRQSFAEDRCLGDVDSLFQNSFHLKLKTKITI